MRVVKSPASLPTSHRKAHHALDPSIIATMRSENRI
jgi:hypothetical protein